jgi:hypothetical protein
MYYTDLNLKKNKLMKLTLKKELPLIGIVFGPCVFGHNLDMPPSESTPRIGIIKEKDKWGEINSNCAVVLHINLYLMLVT